MTSRHPVFRHADLALVCWAGMAVLGSPLVQGAEKTSAKKAGGPSPFPMGKPDAPLMVRTYLPNPISGSPEVFAHHFRPEESVQKLEDAAENTAEEAPEVKLKTAPGIPAAIAISFGPDLSACWDTTECRLLYTWRGGFLDMSEVWNPEAASLPDGEAPVATLKGRLTFVARGALPISVSAGAFGLPRYLGYEMKDGYPEFHYLYGSLTIHERLVPGPKGKSLKQEFSVENSPGNVIFQFDPANRPQLTTPEGKWEKDVLVIAEKNAGDFSLQIDLSQPLEEATLSASNDANSKNPGISKADPAPSQ